jgi:hypothetical protein
MTTLQLRERPNDARDKKGNTGLGVWMWWTDGSRMDDDGRVGAAALSVNGDGWTVFHNYIGKARMEAFDAELLAIRIAL